jgi:hypothetical protein
MLRGRLLYAECPRCLGGVYISISQEIQGVPPWTGLIESVDEIVQDCYCELSQKELDDLVDSAEEYDPGSDPEY